MLGQNSYKILYFMDRNESKSNVEKSVNGLPVSVRFVYDLDEFLSSISLQQFNIAFLYSNLIKISTQDLIRKLKLIEVKTSFRIPPLFFLTKGDKNKSIEHVLNNGLQFYEVDHNTFLENIVNLIINYSDLSLTKKPVTAKNHLVTKLLPKFIANRHKDVDSLELLVKNRNFSEIERTGHTLKGVCGIYGFENLGQIAENLERAALDQNFAQCNSLFRCFQLEVKTIAKCKC